MPVSYWISKFWIAGQGPWSSGWSTLLKRQFVGTNPSHGKVVFLLAFFIFFLLFLHFLHHCSIQSAVSCVVPLWGATLLWDQLPAMVKRYRDQLVTARWDLYEKSWQYHLWGENIDVSAMYAANPKKWQFLLVIIVKQSIPVGYHVKN